MFQDCTEIACLLMGRQGFIANKCRKLHGSLQQGHYAKCTVNDEDHDTLRLLKKSANFDGAHAPRNVFWKYLSRLSSPPAFGVRWKTVGTTKPTLNRKFISAVPNPTYHLRTSNVKWKKSGLNQSSGIVQKPKWSPSCFSAISLNL